ncbi:ATP-dependent DNA helicase RecG [Candidatus Uhrbacteria bacterium]|nr:ATP-dependent DNA helicase RecG [Candidatus Uhrbacteria bacterium]
MTASLDQPVTVLHRMAKRLERPLGRIGIRTTRELLEYAPVRHDDLRTVTAIRDLRVGVAAVIHGKIVDIRSRRSVRRRMVLTEALVSDATGSMRCVWFQQPYLAHVYPTGTEVAIAGTMTSDTYGLQVSSPVIEFLRDVTVHTSRMVPVYALTSGITQKQLRTLVHAALPYLAALPETLPHALVAREGICSRASAFRELHFPTTPEALTVARDRLAFEEVVMHLLRVRTTRAEIEAATAPTIPLDGAATDVFIRALPFPLTRAQQRAVQEILSDMAGGQASGVNGQVSGAVRPMQRLLNGDVGSGKTAVAMIAAVTVARAGYQTAYLAPTDVLARQQARAFCAVCQPMGVHVALWTASAREIDGAPATLAVLARAVREGTAAIIIGTHAILSSRVSFAALALAIVDEQHRFGVEQRAALRAKVDSQQSTVNSRMMPHLLSMTATPIPRTLSLAFLGDLAVSVLDELPRNRTPVRTSVVSPGDRVAMTQAIRSEIAAGRQVFIVCPMIESDPGAEIAAVTEAYERAQRAFPGVPIGLLHGRLRPRVAAEVMTEFATQRSAILVATTVIEVGVDHPNATVMVIEDAERFGLAQLHQLRGRVGRGSASGTCYLTTRSAEASARQRLERVASCTDGFALAELDLRVRGPGAVFGLEQSGRPEFQFATFDPALFARASRAIAALPHGAMAGIGGTAAHLE